MESSIFIERNGGPAVLLEAPQFLDTAVVLHDAERDLRWLQRLVANLLRLHKFCPTKASAEKAYSLVSSKRYGDDGSVTKGTLQGIFQKYKNAAHIAYALRNTQLPYNQLITCLKRDWSVEFSAPTAVKEAIAVRSALLALRPIGYNAKKPTFSDADMLDPTKSRLWSFGSMRRAVEGIPEVQFDLEEFSGAELKIIQCKIMDGNCLCMMAEGSSNSVKRRLDTIPR